MAKDPQPGQVEDEDASGPCSLGARGRAAHPWLLLVNLFFVSPVLLYNFDLRSGGRVEALALWNLTVSALLLVGLQLVVRRPAPLLLALSPLALVVVADLFMIVEFDTRLNSAYLALIAHNGQEVGEFLQLFGGHLAAVLAAFVAFYWLCASKLRGVVLQVPRRWGVVALGLAAASYGLAFRGAGHDPGVALRHVLLRDTSSPFGVVSQATVAYWSYQQASSAPSGVVAFRFAAARAPVAAPEVYVLVLGETSRPDHWGLNGYRRDTSPRLARLPGLVSFSDVTAEAVTTHESVPLIITRATATDPLRAYREPSLVRAFAEAGFRTAWLSNQELSEYTGRAHQLAAEADTVRYFERRHDEVLVAPFERLLDEDRSPGDKLLVVLHQLGSHSLYENRFPAEFARFSRLPAGSAREALVNAYDDTIRYTDHVLAEVISRLEARRDVTSALLFVSDHGENLMDDERRFRLHGQGTVHEVRTAQLFWASPAFERLRPDAVALARARARAPLSTAAVFDSFADLGGLAGPAFDRSRSVFSPAFVPRRRLFLHQGALRDFDQEPAR